MYVCIHAERDRDIDLYRKSAGIYIYIYIYMWTDIYIYIYICIYSERGNSDIKIYRGSARELVRARAIAIQHGQPRVCASDCARLR